MILSPGLIFALALVLVVTITSGCAQRAVAIQTLADRDYPFEDQTNRSVHLAMADFDDGPALERTSLSLSQRNVLAGLEVAFLANDFALTEIDRAELLIRIVTGTHEGERDTWRTVPVYEHTYGTNRHQGPPAVSTAPPVHPSSCRIVSTMHTGTSHFPQRRVTPTKRSG